ncbi:hypothetical protein A3852_29905 [Rhodococcus qingshengii]|nr:hypothetical protein A3852_29905 [Rhodococcus qingshengii]
MRVLSSTEFDGYVVRESAGCGSAVYPASRTAATTWAGSRSTALVTDSVPADADAWTVATPATALTSSRTEASQWPQVMPVTSAVGREFWSPV